MSDGLRCQDSTASYFKCLIGMFGILSISGQNRHLSTEHDQNSFAGASSTYFRGLVHQRGHPHGKMGK